MHTPYHSQSAWKVEKMNLKLKTLIAKICSETNLKWPDPLPLALMNICQRPQQTRKLSPYKYYSGGRCNSLELMCPPKMSLLAGDENVTQSILQIPNL